MQQYKTKKLKYASCWPNLFGNVECPAVSFLMPPITAEYFTKYRVIWLFETLQKWQRNTKYTCCWNDKDNATAENQSINQSRL